jgi:hypothetical protein
VQASAAAGLVGGSGRGLDTDGGEESWFPCGSSPLRLPRRGAVGEWPCGCGRRYRVLAEPLMFWALGPRSGGTGETEACVDCGADLEEAFALEVARVVSASILG